MSVYRTRKSPFWQYDFELNGHRFFGSTKRTGKADALAFEAAKREGAKAVVARADARAAGAPMTFDEAAGKWWVEVGMHHANQADTWRNIGWLVEAIGKATILPDISTKTVAGIVAKRRATRYGRKKKLVSNGTVNRSVTELLRRIMRRAAVVWEEPGLRPIDWASLILPEPQERVREASDVEERKLTGAIRQDVRAVLEFLILTGCRRNEAITLTWDKVDWSAREIRITGKGDRFRIVPITAGIRRLLWPLRAHHDTAVFTYEAQLPNPARKIARSDRVPLTVNGFKKLWRNTKAAAGVADFRLHDTRHTTGTRVLRATGNLKLVQKLLGHSDIATTAKYAHALVDDVREGMEITASASNRNRRRTAAG